MAVDEREGGVVPAPPEVVADIVVGRATDPARHRVGIGRARLEHDHRLFEVGLVVIRAEERRAPVVHRVHEHVVQDDPAVAPLDTTVVDHPRIDLADRLVLLRRDRRSPARDAAADKERGGEAGIDQASEQAHASQPARSAEARPVRAPVPAGKLDPVHRSGHEPEVALDPRLGQLFGESLEGQLTSRHDDLGAAADRRAQEVAVFDIAGRRHREEQLAGGVPPDRLEPLQQLDVAHAWVGPVARSGSPSRFTIARTERWLR